MIHDDATRAQIAAADPVRSTWLSANAGSGKTRVLTDRVARLLLGGVDPQQILCLTYTKAAASEMQNRLFKRLGAWAMLADTDLKAALTELGEAEAQDLALARTLFARAIETPGGLKIQTIHSFCSGLLRRFPLEAGVNPLFQEMEERAADLLRADIVDRMALGPDADRVRNLARFVTDQDLGKLTREIIAHQEGLATSRSWAEIAADFDVPLNFRNADIEASLFVGDERDLLDRLIPAMQASNKTDQKMAAMLTQITALDASALDGLQSFFLTTQGEIRKNFVGKPVQTALPDDMPALDAFADRFITTQQLIHAHAAAQKTSALRDFAASFIQHYTTEKLTRGWLDFDDLILKTRALLSNDAVASWVLYRLDGGISHVLVDEAQDTSPVQWQVIESLTQEFTSGEGVDRDAPRTLFVVGDKKQSIYSFQGADPDEFDRMQAEFGTKLADVGTPLANRSLEFSFRSSDAILRLVDASFVGMDSAGFVPDQKHRAFHADKPGRVDVWPLLEPVSKKEERHWTDPLDLTFETHHTVVLAQYIADQIAQMIAENSDDAIPEKIPDGGTVLRPVRPGDIMVLVQRRSPLFHEIIRACKQRALPIAGADRMRVGAELAVRDLLALLSFMATPEDDLSLATCLKSPLFGWSEKRLFDLANTRGKKTYLWDALRNDPGSAEDTVTVLRDLRNQIDFLRPYNLLERVLTRHGGRKRLLARLGKEAEDGIDALLSQALAYERSAVPSLTGFLTWAEADDLEIKRQIDGSGDLIRVMTVHGAKGLEAPVVILPDCAQRTIQVRDEILNTGETLVWKTNADVSPPKIQDAIDAKKDTESRERLRLLYVAMTRAESWLIVAAAGKQGSDGMDWHHIVSRGMQHVGAVDHMFPLGQGYRYEFGDWGLPRVDAISTESVEIAALEPFFSIPARMAVNPDKPLSPSDLGGAKALSSERGLTEDIAMARGTFIHNLLDLGDAATPDADIPPDLLPPARAEAAQTRNDPANAWIFADSVLSEVTVHAQIQGRKIAGIIDRLIVEESVVTAVDFKTNQVVPDNPETCPDSILRQMGAYANALAQIYPGRRIETGILWTATAQYMSLPQNIVIDALADAVQLDAPDPHS